MTRHADIDNNIQSRYIRDVNQGGRDAKQAFIDDMAERGYEPKTSRNGNITATKGDDTVRYAPLADHDRHNPRGHDGRRNTKDD